MNQQEAERRISQMIQLIKQEAEEKAKIIQEEAAQKMEKEKNKVYNLEREKLLAEFEKSYENYRTTMKLENSRKINACRLDVQSHRNNLLEDLKRDLDTKLRAVIKDTNKYRELLKNLILQGLIRLLEKRVTIKCRKEDVELVNSVLADVSAEYVKFMKDNVNKDVEVELEITDKLYLSAEDIGGVVLYCNGFKIVYDNSLRSRLSLCFDDSVPDFRNQLFPSLAR